MNGLNKYITSNNLNRSNLMQISKNPQTTLDPKIAEILDSSLRQNGLLKPKKQENDRITEQSHPPVPCFGQPKPNKISFQEPSKEIQEEADLFEDCSKAIAILNKYRNKLPEPETNHRKLHTSISHYSRDTDASSKEEPKSYSQLYKEGRDVREVCRSKNALYSIIYENELLGNNTYLRQHLNRRIRSSSAALIIQRWFREQNRQSGSKKSQSPKHKQEWVGILSSKGGNSNLDSKLKKRQSRRDNKSRNQSINAGCYEYEELETENGSLPMRKDHSGQKKILEEVSIQLKGNLVHSGKKKTPSPSTSATKKDKGDKENFAQELEKESNSKNNNGQPTRPIKVIKKKRRSDSLERMLGIDPYSLKDYEEAAITIQRAFRTYLLNKSQSLGMRSRNESLESIKKLKSKASNKSFEQQQAREYLSNELKNSHQHIRDLQNENESLRQNLIELEDTMEKKIEERVGIEKAKFKELLDQYTQFIDKLLQEKVDITQYYEVLTTSNQDLKLKFKQYEEKNYENIVSNLEKQNKKLLEEKSQLLGELENLREENQQQNNPNSLLKEIVEKLEDENESLKNKLHRFIDEKEAQFNEANEANVLLLQKLRSSEVYTSELEEKLEISENKCKNLLQQSKNISQPQPQSATNVGNGTVESLKSRIYIPRPENFISDDLLMQQSQQQNNNNVYTPGKYDEEYILSVRNNTESETQSIPAETHRDKPSLLFKLVESECDLPPDSAKMSDKAQETTQHLEFSFEAKDSGSEQNPNNNVIIESFEVDPAVEEENSNRMKEENNEVAESHRLHDAAVADFKILEYRKMSQEYFSGKFVDEIEQHSRQSYEEENKIQEQALDEEDQSIEINMLIENISKKLELAKLNRDDDNYRDPIKFTKTLSLPKFEETEERSPLYRESHKSRNLSQKNLHQNDLFFEEEEEEAEEEHYGHENGHGYEEERPEINLPLQMPQQNKSNNIKKGILDTLKKADLLFGRANI